MSFLKTLVLIFCFILLLSGQHLVFAADDKVIFTPQVPIGNSSLLSGDSGYDFSKSSIDITGDNTLGPLAQYIRWIYKFLIGICGILATIMMMVGGVRWLVSAGDSGAITEAKNTIQSALVGLVIAAGAYLILATVNTDLVNFKATTIPAVVAMGCCQMAAACNDGVVITDCTTLAGTLHPTDICIAGQCVDLAAHNQQLAETLRLSADNCTGQKQGAGCKIFGVNLGDNYTQGWCDANDNGSCIDTKGRPGEWCGKDAAGSCLLSGGIICPGSTSFVSGGRDCTGNSYRCCK